MTDKDLILALRAYGNGVAALTSMDAKDTLQHMAAERLETLLAERAVQQEARS